MRAAWSRFFYRQYKIITFISIIKIIIFLLQFYFSLKRNFLSTRPTGPLLITYLRAQTGRTKIFIFTEKQRFREYSKLKP